MEDVDAAKKEAGCYQDECNTVKDQLSDSVKVLQKTQHKNEELLGKQSELETETETLRDKLKTALDSKAETEKLLQNDLSEKERINEKLKAKCDKAEQDNLA